MSVYGKSFALGAGHGSYQVQFCADKVKHLKRDGFFTLNKTLLPAKIFYFLFMGSMVSFIPFAPVYMQQLGLNSFQIGIIRTVQPIGTIIACPLWGSIADKFSIHRKLTLVGIIIGGIATVATYFTPSAVGGSPGNATSVMTGPPLLTLADIYPTFVVMLALSIVSVLFLAHISPMVDANVMQLLKDHPRTDYGKQRLWGAVGWGSMAGVTGLAMDIYGKFYPDGNRFLPAYIVFTIFIVPTVIPILVMRYPPHARPEAIYRDILKLFKCCKVVVGFLVAGICGLSLGIVTNFQFLFLNELKAPSLVMGLTLTVTCVSEIPLMYLSGKFIRCAGEETVFFLALFCYSVRFFLYSVLKDPWLILPIEVLHGICYGCLWPAMTSFANRIAPRGMGATVQNILSAVSMGVGQTVGTIVGGYIYGTYGPPLLFLYCGYLCSATTVVFVGYIILDHLLARCRPTSTFYDEI